MPAGLGISPGVGGRRFRSAGPVCRLGGATLAVHRGPFVSRPRRAAETRPRSTVRGSRSRLLGRSRDRGLLASDLEGGPVEVMPRDRTGARRCSRSAGDRYVQRGGDRVGEVVMGEC